MCYHHYRYLSGSVADFHLEEPLLLSYSQHPAVPGSGLALMSVVGGYTRQPPPYPGGANPLYMPSEDNSEILPDLEEFLSAVSSGQPQVNFTLTSQQQVNLGPHVSSEADVATANQGISIKVPGLNPEQANQRNCTSDEVNANGTNLTGQFINFVLTGQHRGNQGPCTSDLGTVDHLNAFVNFPQANGNLGFLPSNEEVNVAVTNHRGALVNDMWTGQPGFNQTNAQTYCQNQAGYILDNNVGKLSNLAHPYPAGTVIRVTQGPVEEEDFNPQDNY